MATKDFKLVISVTHTPISFLDLFKHPSQEMKFQRGHRIKVEVNKIVTKSIFVALNQTIYFENSIDPQFKYKKNYYIFLKLDKSYNKDFR